MAEEKSKAPNVGEERVAVVLAGPPGAKGILEAAMEDGGYDTWLIPQYIRDLEQMGERFFPMELASLVHEESSLLASDARVYALERGDNIVIDTVLSSEKLAQKIGSQLTAADYQVHVVDVEVPVEASEEKSDAVGQRGRSKLWKVKTRLGVVGFQAGLRMKFLTVLTVNYDRKSQLASWQNNVQRCSHTVCLELQLKKLN